MRSRDGGPPRRAVGFTIVELLIAMVVGLLIVGGSLALLNTARETSRTDRLRVELQQNARYALDMFNRDLQQAGQGMDPNTVFGIVAASDGGGQPDTLYLLFVEPDTPDHSVKSPTMGREKSEVRLAVTCDDPVDDIQAGDFVYLAKGSARGIAEVMAVTRGGGGGGCSDEDPPTKEIGQVTLTVTPVDGEGHGWVFQGNESGAVAVKATPVVYYAADGEGTDRRLMRATSRQGTGWAGAPIAESIVDFQVELVFSDGTAAPAADPADGDPDNDYEDIDTVRVTLVARARHRDKDLTGGREYTRTYSVSVTPRNQLYTRNL